MWLSDKFLLYKLHTLCYELLSFFPFFKDFSQFYDVSFVYLWWDLCETVVKRNYFVRDYALASWDKRNHSAADCSYVMYEMDTAHGFFEIWKVVLIRTASFIHASTYIELYNYFLRIRKIYTVTVSFNL